MKQYHIVHFLNLLIKKVNSTLQESLISMGGEQGREKETAKSAITENIIMSPSKRQVFSSPFPLNQKRSGEGDRERKKVKRKAPTRGLYHIPQLLLTPTAQGFVIYKYLDQHTNKVKNGNEIYLNIAAGQSWISKGKSVAISNRFLKNSYSIRVKLKHGGDNLEFSMVNGLIYSHIQIRRLQFIA